MRKNFFSAPWRKREREGREGGTETRAMIGVEDRTGLSEMLTHSHAGLPGLVPSLLLAHRTYPTHLPPPLTLLGLLQGYTTSASAKPPDVEPFLSIDIVLLWKPSRMEQSQNVNQLQMSTQWLCAERFIEIHSLRRYFANVTDTQTHGKQPVPERYETSDLLRVMWSILLKTTFKSQSASRYVCSCQNQHRTRSSIH